ncbi:prepilin-type N-terminal cleavage/methylation domain-containing protein [bacterium]|nr:prepilin-type N-terminal cleavage/methylation domain-containing protein [bacterium]
MKNKKGFTLIELLIVIAIIAILAAVVFVALDPLTRFRDARNAQRWTDVTSILGAIKIDQVDNGGSYLAAVTAATSGTALMIGDSTGTCTATSTTSNVDLAGLATEGYLGSVPYDPSSGSSAETSYYLIRETTGTITIGSCEPEGSSVISVSR